MPFFIPILVAVGAAVISWGAVAVSNWTSKSSTIVNYPTDDVYTNTGGSSSGISFSNPVVIAGIAALAIFLLRK